MPFQKGNTYGKGRPKGSPNKSVEAMRRAWLQAFEAMQAGPNNLLEWANKNSTEFYRLSKTLIPMEVVSDVDVTSGGEPITKVTIQIEHPKQQDGTQD